MNSGLSNDERNAKAEQERQEALDQLIREGIFDEIKVSVATAAYAASRRFTPYTSKADIEQVMWEWVVKAPKKILRWYNDNNAGGFQRILGSVLYDEGTYYGRRARADKLGYRLGEEFYYTKPLLRKLLPSVFNKEHWVNGPDWPDADNTRVTNGRALNEGHEWVATLADVSRALSRLSQTDRTVLEARFYSGAHPSDVPDSTWSTRVDSALKRLFGELGGPKWLSSDTDRLPDEPGRWRGGRRALSNAEARAITNDQWEAQ